MDKHHNAPPLADRLELDHASLWASAHEVLGLEALDPILTDDDLETYSARAKALKGVGATIEKARKAEKEQILKDGRTVEDFFAKLSKPLKDAADAVVAKINDWQRKKLEEERARQRAEAEKAKAAATPFDDEPAPPPPPVQAAARVVSSATGKVTASASRFWNFRITDAAKVPRQYCSPNEAAIKAVIAAGAREIEGVEVFEDIRTAIR